MRILVAYERYGKVRDAFIAAGHNAISCDIVETINPGPHIKDNVWNVLEKDTSWDMLIAFPPCTYVCFAGIRWNVGNPKRQHKTDLAIKNFKALWSLPIKKIAIENPVGVIPRLTKIKWTQKIQPYQFGDPYFKTTCLWLKNLPELQPTNIVIPHKMHTTSGGKRISSWYSNKKNMRDITFDGIATAMASQWV